MRENEMKKGRELHSHPFTCIFPRVCFYIPFHSAYSLVIAGPIVKPHA